VIPSLAGRGSTLLAGLDKDIDPEKQAMLVVFISGGPGCGKSRVLQDLPRMLQQQAAADAAALPLDAPYREQLQQMFNAENHVQLSTTFTNGTALRECERTYSGAFVISNRALYSAFGSGAPFDVFIETVRNECDPCKVTMAAVLRELAVVRHVPTLGRAQRPMFITYTVDEAHILTPDREVKKDTMPYGSLCAFCAFKLPLSVVSSLPRVVVIGLIIVS
jgi:hypothetical protein